jgi:Holliday junction resolvase
MKPRDKGARFEREVVDTLKDNGIEAKRNLEQVRDSGGDIIIQLRGRKTNIECKVRKSMAIYEYWEQSSRAAEKIEAMPMLVIKADYKDTLAVLSFETLLELLK